MYETEKEAKTNLKAEGWTVLASGAPDFLCYKFKDGKICDLLFVEVKKPGEELRENQRTYRWVLEGFGLKYKIVPVEPKTPIKIDPVLEKVFEGMTIGIGKDGIPLLDENKFRAWQIEREKELTKHRKVQVPEKDYLLQGK